MAKRVMLAERTKPEETSKAGKKKRKAGKTLLSFGADEGDDVAPVIKKAKVNPSFKTSGTEKGDDLDSTTIARAPEKAKAKATKAIRRRSPSLSEMSPPVAGVEKETSAPVHKHVSPSASPEPPQIASTTSALERTNAQIAALKESMKRNTTTSQNAPEKKKSALEAMIPSNATRGRKRGKVTDEQGALDLFNSFRQRLGDRPQAEEVSVAAKSGATDGSVVPEQTEAVDEEEAVLCDLHFIANCQSCKSWDEDATREEDEDDNDPNWMSHALSFAKDTLGKDLEWRKRMEDFEVIDPREKARGIAEEKKKGRSKGREWDKPRDKTAAKMKT